ncbi:MAG: hypothetical protein CR974_01740 [Gammaproteobacteria bacterium]|nr:MAG: hypothetical protein CR974_01740 [Gammaproteobacteria bacterium]
MKEINYYNEARNYLLSFDKVTDAIIDKHLNASKTLDDICTTSDLFKQFISHAKNRQGMPNSIGNLENLSTILCCFDVAKVVEKYTSWEELFDAIDVSPYNPPGRMVKDNNKSHWVIYCKSIISVANFLSRYKNISEFKIFINGFLTNEQSQLALPLLLSKEIFGFGFALACDFLKENVSPEFIKPDTHINDIALGLGITSSTEDYIIFKDMLTYCHKIKVLPYKVDKLFWLVGSGDFYLSDIKINSSKDDFISFVKNL